jgi:hypothetical protein
LNELIKDFEQFQELPETQADEEFLTVERNSTEPDL